MARTADGQRSFRELVSQAPAAPSAQAPRLVGTLSRAQEEGKFVFTLADGRSVTLDIDAVREHRALGGAAGQELVEITVDPERLPREAMAPTSAGLLGGFNLYPPWTLFWLDHKLPFWDTIPGRAPDVKLSYADHTGWEDVKNPRIDVAGPGQVPPGGDPWGGFAAGQGAAPFALATPHQAPAAALAAMQGPAQFGGVFGGGTGWLDPATIWWFDQTTAWWLDQNTGYLDIHTHPIVDAGATGFPPYLD